jgi:carboxymethylenebutenolidase
MNLFQRYLVDEFVEDYQEGHLTRREALKLLAGVTGSLVMATSLLAGCAPPEETSSADLPGAGPTSPPAVAEAGTATQPAAPATEPAATATQPAAGSETPPAETTAAGSAEIQAMEIEFPGEGGATLRGYLAYPSGNEPRPVILVCHENRGLTAHIQDVTRRLAAAGYTALAVDLLSRQGGTGALSSEEVPGALSNSPPEQFVQDFMSGLSYLQGQPFAQTERVGMVGFCFGGGVTWLMATRMPELLAAVPFYGPHPPVEEVPNIQAAVLAIYAERDQRINSGIPAIEAAMQEHNKTYEKVIYPNADHAFHNDTGGRYNPEAARDAWSRTLDWFNRYVVQA